ncbi:MAG: DUF2341 domain-containing protein [Chitinivibrionales bacterium]|nr:DUF2341 domain-containing protein [Chitinivibrionales bacterium]
MTLRMWISFGLRVALAAVVIHPACSNETNPFSDYSNASAHILERSFGTQEERDTLSIFKTESLSIVFAARDLVDSCVISLPNNMLVNSRLSQQAELIKLDNTDGSALLSESYTIRFSLYDTGQTTIALRTYFSNGKHETRHFALYASSPLSPQSFSAKSTDSVMLQTGAVSDNFVLYHWIFEHESLAVNSATHSFQPAHITRDGGIGKLKVSDVSGAYFSPQHTFSYTISDDSPPVITYAGLISGDTIYAADSQFVFSVNIADQQGGAVDSAYVNGQPFDSASAPHYTKQIGLHLAGAAPSPLKLTVTAFDQERNSASRDFFVVYDKSYIAANIVFSVTSASERNSKTKRLFGLMRSANNQYVAAQLSITGPSNQSFDSMYSFRNPTFWNTSFEFREDTTEISAEIRNVLTGATYDTSWSIYFTHDTLDMVPPAIAAVLTYDSLIIEKVFYSTDTIIPLGVFAFDEASGIKRLLINNQNVYPHSHDKSFFYKDSLSISHLQSGNDIVIFTEDSASNTAVHEVRIYQNTPPVLQGIAPADTLPAGRAFWGRLLTRDAENDDITLSLASAPNGMKLIGDSISWTPDSLQTGDHWVSVTLADGFEAVTQSFRLSVLPLPGYPCSLSISSTKADIQGNNIYIDSAAGPGSLQFVIHDADPPAIEQYDILVTLNNTITLQSTQKARTFAMSVDPRAASASGGELAVSIRDKGGDSDTLTYTIYFRSGPVSLFYLKIAFNTTPAGADLSEDIHDFPVYILLRESNFNFPGCCTAPRLVFQKGNGDKLPFQIEYWDNSNMAAALWVKMDTLQANQDTQYIRLVYDTSANALQQDYTGHAVFDTANAFEGVWHLSDEVTSGSATDTIFDATANANHGFDTCDATSQWGRTGRGLQFDGVDDVIAVPGTPSLQVQGFTISFWGNTAESSTSQSFVSMPLSGIDNSYQFWMNDDSKTIFWSTSTILGDRAINSGQNIAQDEWYHFAAINTGYEIDFFINGVPVNDVNFSGDVTYNGLQDLLFGADLDYGVLGVFAQVLLDEIRIESIDRSPTWIKACYENQKEHQTLYNISHYSFSYTP